MIPLTLLWLPILLSAVIVFFGSFITHMVPRLSQKRLPQVSR